MNDDLVSFKALVVSGAQADRRLLRDCSTKASFPVDWAEADVSDIAETCRRITDDALDIVLVDANLKQDARDALHRAVQSSNSAPLLIVVGPSNAAARDVARLHTSADGVMVRPIDPPRATEIIDNCARARLTKQVLVVDDSANVRLVVRKVLQSSRFRIEVAEAPDGDSAVKQVASRPFDLVLLDCNMPGVDGFATLGLFKKVRSTVPVVMITSTRDARLEDRARASGADEFMFKPFYANDVDAVLRRLFGLMGPTPH